MAAGSFLSQRTGSVLRQMEFWLLLDDSRWSVFELHCRLLTYNSHNLFPGATNVGTVKVYFDKALQTNRPKYRHAYNSRDKCLGTTVSLTKGDAFGEFRMGSTIVLVFEAPVNFNFRIAPGHRVRMGECLGYLAKAKHVDKVQIDRSNVIINAS